MKSLEQRVYEALNRARVISEAPSQRIDSSKIKQGKPGDTTPTLNGTPVMDKIRELIYWPLTESRVREIEDIVKRAWHGPDIPANLIERGTFAHKKLVANDKRGATEAARIHGVSRQTVYDWREKYRDEEAA